MSNDSIAAVTAAGASYTPPVVQGINNVSGQRTPKQEMDSEVFMSLLVAQLRHQDPSSPMDTNQMISQTTQLATMEKLNSMDTTATENFALQMRTSAAALVGQHVSWADTDGNVYSGIATSVSFAQGVPQVTVAGQSVPLDQISGVSSNPAAANTSPEDEEPSGTDPVITEN